MFGGFGVLERLIPGYDEINAALHVIAPQGYMFALNVRHVTPEFYTATYPSLWVDSYTAHRYVLFDPVVLWGAVSTGRTRWSEISFIGIKATSLRVMSEAAKHGLIFGAAFSTRNFQAGGEKCLFSASRQDREFSDLEMDELERIFHHLMQAVGTVAGLSAAERITLQGLAEGMTQDEIAVRDGISRETVKKRVEKARKTLGAVNATQAVAIATMRGLISLRGIAVYRASD